MIRLTLVKSLFIVAVLFPSLVQANDDSKAFQVKAAYLYQFFRYTDWPNLAQANTIGLVSNSAIKDYFTTIDGKLFNEQEINIIQVTDLAQEYDCCNMLYFAPGTETLLAHFSDKFADGVVTVADDSLTNGNLAMIQLMKRGTKLKFAVYLATAKAKSVDLSSRLLRVALAVK